MACDCDGGIDTGTIDQSTAGVVVVSGPKPEFSAISMRVVHVEGLDDTAMPEVHVIAEATNRQQWMYGLDIRGYLRMHSQKESFKGVCAVRYLNHGRATEVDYDVHEAHVEKRAGLTMSLVCEKRFKEKRSGEPQAPQLPQTLHVALQGVLPSGLVQH